MEGATRMSQRAQQTDQLVQQARHLQSLGRAAEAEQVYRHVLAVDPGHDAAAHGLGVLALQAGQNLAALACLDQAIAGKPSAALYHLHRAHALLGLGRFEEAIAACNTALRYKRNSAETYQALGHALTDSGQPAKALAAYRDALRLDPALPDIHNNLGTALRNTNRLEEAEARLREALRRAPRDTGVMANLSSVLKELGKVEAAETCLRDGLRLNPTDPVLLYNQGLLMLLMGHFAAGWRGFEHRFGARAVPARGLRQPEWQGETLGDRTLLVHAEQGLGDIIQFCRFLPLIQGRIVFEAPRPMLRLLSSLPGAPPIVAAGEALPPFDLVCPLMSLPHRFGIPVEAATVPYLAAEADRIAHWRDRIGSGGFKVGIAWQGNPNRHEDKGRSVTLTQFAPLAKVPGVRLISLQRGFGAEQCLSLPAVEGFDASFDGGTDAFLDTAAVMASLDLVISTDTAVAHLAGALGHKVWLPLRFVPDWRWMLGRSDSPWYPTMRLFRQIRRDDWAPVFAAMAQALAELA